MRAASFCPVHEHYSHVTCGYDCLPWRIEWRKAYQALYRYWLERDRGVPPKRRRKH